MEKGRILTDESEIKKILEESKNIAVLGMSTNPDKDSYMVAKYLLDKDYNVIPVRPGADEIMGRKVIPDLDSVDEKIDILDVFRRPEQIIDHVDEAIRLKPKVFWMQLGIRNEEAAAKLVENGIDVIMDRCIKVDHKRLCR